MHRTQILLLISIKNEFCIHKFFLSHSKEYETVTIKSKNYPNYSFGVRRESISDLYITTGHVISFDKLTPGLTGNPESVSFRSIEDGKYIVNQDTLLRLKEFKHNEDFKKAASFNIIHDKFFAVSILYQILPQHPAF